MTELITSMPIDAFRDIESQVELLKLSLVLEGTLGGKNKVEIS
jgi:hypothetical protein